MWDSMRRRACAKSSSVSVSMAASGKGGAQQCEEDTGRPPATPTVDSGEKPAHDLAGTPARRRIDVEVRDHPDPRLRPLGDANALRGGGGDDRRGSPPRWEIYHDDIGIGRHDAGPAGAVDETGERACVGVILGEPVEVMVEAVECRGGEDARL